MITLPWGCAIEEVSPGKWRAYTPGLFNNLPLGYSPPAVDSYAAALALLPHETKPTPEQLVLL